MVKIDVNLGRLKGLRGILCGLLCAAIISTILCIGLFAGKTNEINSALRSDVCSLFLTSKSPLSGSDPSICHYVIGGSATVLALLLVLLIETLVVVFFAFAFTDHLVMILLRGSAMFVSLILMFCVSIIISAGVGTTCVTWTNLTKLSCSDHTDFGQQTPYLGMMVASAVFSWIATALLAVIMVLVGAPLKSRVKLSAIKKPLLKS